MRSHEGVREQRADLLDACLTLKPAHIFHNLIDIAGCHAFDLGHIAELPMVRLDAVGGGPLESLISVMVRLVDLMHERGSLVRPHRLFSMTGCTICVECSFADLELGRHRRACDCLCRLCGLCGIAGHEKAQPQQPYSDLKSFWHRDFHRISIADHIQSNDPTGCSNSVISKAAGESKPRATGTATLLLGGCPSPIEGGTGTGKARASPPPYVEDFDEARTPLAACFNILRLSHMRWDLQSRPLQILPAGSGNYRTAHKPDLPPDHNNYGSSETGHGVQSLA